MAKTSFFCGPRRQKGRNNYSLIWWGVEIITAWFGGVSSAQCSRRLITYFEFFF
jgi:hypothetical protein